MSTLSKDKTSLKPRQALERFIDSFEELLESLEYTNPEFWKEIEDSRKSGVVTALEIEKRLGIK